MKIKPKVRISDSTLISLFSFCLALTFKLSLTYFYTTVFDFHSLSLSLSLSPFSLSPLFSPFATFSMCIYFFLIVSLFHPAQASVPLYVSLSYSAQLQLFYFNLNSIKRKKFFKFFLVTIKHLIKNTLFNLIHDKHLCILFTFI